jgi:hypothetical protein
MLIFRELLYILIPMRVYRLNAAFLRNLFDSREYSNTEKIREQTGNAEITFTSAYILNM